MYRVEYNKEYRMQLQVLSFAERYRILLNSKKKVVVYIKNEFDNSTFRYRCYNFKEALENSDKYEVTYFLCSEIPEILPYIDRISLLIFQRTTWDVNSSNLLSLAKKKGIKNVYDVDDLIYKIDYVPYFINHIGVPFNQKTIYYYLGFSAGYEMIAKDCDNYITTTSYLKKMIERDYNRPTYVVHNFLNNEQVSESNEILEKRTYDDSKFIIGYFSGSPSHMNDFRLVEPALIELLNKYDNIYIKIVGFMKLSNELEKFVSSGRIIMKELVPYQQLQYEIGEVDVNIVPLVNSSFNESKSELKFFEAGIVKVPSCITHTELYDEIVYNEVNGMLCNDGEWFEKLEKLYLDKDLRNKLAEEAYNTARQYYLPLAQSRNIEEVYDEILNK